MTACWGGADIRYGSSGGGGREWSHGLGCGVFGGGRKGGEERKEGVIVAWFESRGDIVERETQQRSASTDSVAS